MRIITSIVALGAALTACADGGNRWLRYGGSCSNPQDVARGKAFVDRAANAGMNGMTICGSDDLWRWREPAKACLRELKAYADANHIPMVVFWANDGCGYCAKTEAAMAKSDFIS